MRLILLPFALALALISGAFAVIVDAAHEPKTGDQ